MIEIREGQTGMHTISNPGQAIFLVIMILVFIVLIALGVGWIAKSTM